MPFFDPLPPRPPMPAPDEWVQPWFNPGDQIIGGVVPVQLLLAQGERAAVAVLHLTADPRGLSFTLTAVRKEPADHDRSGMGWHRTFDDPGEAGLRFGLGFADGTKVQGDAWHRHDHDPGAAPPSHRLQGRGGGGSEARWDQELRLEPAPPPGPVTFACAWPELGIEEVTVEVDGDLLAAAAAQATILWPEIPLPDPFAEEEGGRWLNFAPDEPET